VIQIFEGLGRITASNVVYSVQSLNFVVFLLIFCSFVTFSCFIPYSCNIKVYREINYGLLETESRPLGNTDLSEYDDDDDDDNDVDDEDR
jgi:hypothetical protein